MLFLAGSKDLGGASLKGCLHSEGRCALVGETLAMPESPWQEFSEARYKQVHLDKYLIASRPLLLSPSLLPIHTIGCTITNQVLPCNFTSPLFPGETT